VTSALRDYSDYEMKNILQRAKRAKLKPKMLSWTNKGIYYQAKHSIDNWATPKFSINDASFGCSGCSGAVWVVELEGNLFPIAMHSSREKGTVAVGYSLRELLRFLVKNRLTIKLCPVPQCDIRPQTPTAAPSAATVAFVGLPTDMNRTLLNVDELLSLPQHPRPPDAL